MIKLQSKIILTLFLIVAPFFANSFETTAQYAILMDYNTGKVMYSKSSATRMTPSSMSKLMTLYVVFSELKNGKLKMDDLVDVSEKAWRVEGSKMFIEVGTKVSVSDLLRGIIIQSGNDACIAIAERISGDEATFVERMNTESAKLGLKDSHFANSTGLPDANHYMSAHDLANLSKIIISEFNEYYNLFSEKEFTYNNITQPNRNYEIGENGIDGLKTGHTMIAGFGIVASAVNSERRLIAVVNGLESERARLEEVKKLLAYGFNNFYNYKLISANVVLDKINVWHGNKKEVGLIMSKDLELVFPVTVLPEHLKTTLRKPNIIYAPINLDQQIADIVVTMPNSQEQIVVGLYPNAEVKTTNFFGKMYDNFMIRLKGADNYL